MTIVSMVDEQFQSRSQKIVTLLFTAFKRDEGVLNGNDLLIILKLFYRVLLFTAPAQDMILLENVYITSKTLIDKYGSTLIQSRALLDKIGPWAGCLLHDHRSAVIATIIQLHYESHLELEGQQVTEAIQLLFVPFLRSNLLYQNLGAAIILNEWASVYRESLNKSNLLYQNLGAAIILNEWASVYRESLNKGVQLDPPLTLLQICDTFLRAPAKNYDELTSAVNHLTMDCKEFVDYCISRGVDRNKLIMGDSVSVEEISKMAFDLCLPGLKAPNHIESLTT
ncbi:unnamed protein product, partial [Strongylus vulgaris]